MTRPKYFDHIRYDFHTHSLFSEDSDAPMQDMVLHAIQLGLEKICFTEHVDYDWPKDEGTFLVDQDAYFAEIDRLRSLYGNRIEIGAGVELGMQPHTMPACQRLLSEYPFDFVIASQHLLDGRDPYYESFWSGKDPYAVTRSYFEAVRANLAIMPDFDSLGHLDYICRYVPDPSFTYNWTDYRDLIDDILTILIRHDKCLEINSGGLRKNGMANPCEGILLRYRQLGGSLITIGSDAHIPDDIARPFSEILSLLQRCGFDRIYTFKYDPAAGKRIRTEHSLI